jgi:ABC-type Fe3+-siderophore transport system permease subunit
MTDPRREIPEPTYHWPGGPTADDDPTPVESALAALKYGAILAAALTIVFFYLATYTGYVAPRAGASLAVLAAFVGPSVIAFLRTALVRRRRRPPGA